MGFFTDDCIFFLLKVHLNYLYKLQGIYYDVKLINANKIKLSNMSNIDNLISELELKFKKYANEKDALAMSKYMKNKFEFFGLKTDLRKSLLKEFLSEHELPDGDEFKEFILKLWSKPQREFHYSAMEIMEKPLKKADDSWMPILEKIISENSWWDSVDAVAAKLIGLYLKKYPKFAEVYPEKWINSDKMWFRRTAILYQLKYKKDTDFERLREYILKTAHEKEFFIRKAQGWTLREYAKTNPEAVREFVLENKSKLSNLTVKEAMKHLS